MAPLKLRRTEGDGGAPKAEIEERRSGVDRRRGKDRRRAKVRRDGAHRRRIRDLYQSDLDRHLWSWTSPRASRKRARKKKKAPARHRRVAGIMASAAGALGAAGLSYFLYRKLRHEERPEDPVAAQADLDESDFEE